MLNEPFGPAISGLLASRAQVGGEPGFLAAALLAKGISVTVPRGP